MTAAGHSWKSRWGRALRVTPVLALGLCLAVAGLILPLPVCLAAAPIVVNSQTGLAISGFDPVTYFTKGKPELGRAGLELRLGGAVWQFRNEGNRAAFAENPDVYMPRFGGYDPVAVGRGETVPGNPLIWAIVAQRIFLFYDNEARTTFLTDPGRIIVTADRKWPALAKSPGL